MRLIISMKKEKRGSGYRVQKMRNGISYSLTFDHKPTNQEVEDALLERLNATVTLVNAPKKTFSECADKYFEVKQNVLSAATYRSDKGRANNLSDEFKNTLLSDMDNIVIQKEINRIASKCAPKTVRNYYTVICDVLNMFNPDFKPNVTVPKRKVKTDKYIPTPAEVKLILDNSIDKYWIMFMLAAYGLRRSEAVVLEWPNDFDLENSLVKIRKAKVKGTDGWVVQNYNKTNESSRDVPISQELIDKIQEQGYVFNGNVDKILEYLHVKQKQLGIPQFRLHDFRAYFATELDQAGFSSKDVQKLGGWSSDTILKTVYQHNRVEKDKELQKKAAMTISKKILE